MHQFAVIRFSCIWIDEIGKMLASSIRINRYIIIDTALILEPVHVLICICD